MLDDNCRYDQSGMGEMICLATPTGLREHAECRSPGVRSPGVLKMRSVENAEC